MGSKPEIVMGANENTIMGANENIISPYEIMITKPLSQRNYSFFKEYKQRLKGSGSLKYVNLFCYPLQDNLKIYR